jgi:hypothetical protein
LAAWTASGLREILSARMDDNGLGAGFFFKIAGLVIAVGVAALIVFAIFWRAAYAFGFFGGFIIIGSVLVLLGWIYDRRNARTQV